jgi:hypothetical protein
MQTSTLILIAVVVVLLVVVGWLLLERRRTGQLRSRFGPEYDRTVDQEGDRRAAEAELEARQRRVESLRIRPLGPDEAERFTTQWRQVQARFVDDPKGAIGDADDLIGGVMEARGYPVGDFEQRAADVSVDHPAVVEHYRAAHDIATRSGRGPADTEALRQAMVHYRALFDDLVGSADTERAPVAAGTDTASTTAADQTTDERGVPERRAS